MTQKKTIFNLNERATSADLNQLQDDLEDYLQKVLCARRQAGTESYGTYDDQVIVLPGGFDAKELDPATLNVGNGVLVRPQNQGFPGNVFTFENVTGADFTFSPHSPGNGYSRFDLIAAVDTGDASTSSSVDIYDTGTRTFAPQLQQKTLQGDLVTLQYFQGLDLTSKPTFRAALYLVVVPDGATSWSDCSLFRIANDPSYWSPNLHDREEGVPADEYQIETYLQANTGVISGQIHGTSGVTGAVLGGRLQFVGGLNHKFGLFDASLFSDSVSTETGAWEEVNLREFSLWGTPYPTIAWDASNPNTKARARFSGVPVGNQRPNFWSNSALQTPLRSSGPLLFIYNMADTTLGFNQSERRASAQNWKGGTGVGVTDYGVPIASGTASTSTGTGDISFVLDLSAVPTISRSRKRWTIFIPDTGNGYISRHALYEISDPANTWWSGGELVPCSVSGATTVPGPGSALAAVIQFESNQPLLRFSADGPTGASWTLYLTENDNRLVTT